MRNNDDSENDYNYSPNEMGNMSQEDPRKYREIMLSNFEDWDAVEEWQNDNLKFMQSLQKQRNYDRD